MAPPDIAARSNPANDTHIVDLNFDLIKEGDAALTWAAWIGVSYMLLHCAYFFLVFWATFSPYRTAPKFLRIVAKHYTWGLLMLKLVVMLAWVVTAMGIDGFLHQVSKPVERCLSNMLSFGGFLILFEFCCTVLALVPVCEEERPVRQKGCRRLHSKLKREETAKNKRRNIFSFFYKRRDGTVCPSLAILYIINRVRNKVVREVVKVLP